MSQDYFKLPDNVPQIGGVYAHYKNLHHEYQVTGLSLNSDTNEWHVEYVPLYEGAVAVKFNRVVSLWSDKATLDGVQVERYPFVRMG
jgi:hypothetical protein